MATTQDYVNDLADGLDEFLRKRGCARVGLTDAQKISIFAQIYCTARILEALEKQGNK